jgi:hypothetical protein
LLGLGAGPAVVNTPVTDLPTEAINTTSVPTQPLPTAQPGQPTMPPEVIAAQQRVRDNPDNPEAMLNLSCALWMAGMPNASYDTLSKVIDLVGPDNEAFYIQAGDRFAEVEGWIPAAAMYFQARKNYGLDGNVPESLSDAFHESMYKGAEKPEAAVVLPFDKIAQVDQPIALVAQSRNAFYAGRLDDANTFLNQVKRLSPNMHEAFLLEAEIGALTDKPGEARVILNGLLADLSAAEWIRVIAEDLLQGLPQSP